VSCEGRSRVKEGSLSLLLLSSSLEWSCRRWQAAESWIRAGGHPKLQREALQEEGSRTSKRKKQRGLRIRRRT
jgi:hypothetical protein